MRYEEPELFSTSHISYLISHFSFLPSRHPLWITCVSNSVYRALFLWIPTYTERESWVVSGILHSSKGVIMQTPGVESNRFRASRLSQVESRQRFFLFRHFSSRSRGGQPAAPQSRFARIMDRVLLAIEIICALIVAWIAVQYIYTVYFDTTPHRLTPAVLPTSTRLPVATITITITPTATARIEVKPTPTLFQEVLPPITGGPGDDGTGLGPAPTAIPESPSDIPAATATSIATTTATATATATIDPRALLPNRLRIPAMFLDSPVQEVKLDFGQWQVSPMDIGHHEGSGNPGQVGNVVLAGHRDINSALFRDLDRLKPGDDVYVSNSLAEYHYIVLESMVVGPDHTEVMDPTPDRRLTLITCTPIGIDTQRLVVIATLDQ